MAQTRISMSPHMVKAEELNEALKRLFKSRCAFCEARDPTSAYRFRPTEEAGPSEAAPARDASRSHLYYSWLTNAWQNIYSICNGCRPIEPSVFPVTGRRCPLPSREEVELYADQPTGLWRGEVAERPVLLDPCGNHDIRREMAALPGGELVPMSRRGEATIRHFNLNRSELIGRRAHSFRSHLDELLAKSRSGGSIASSFDFANLEFGMDWFLLLYQLALKLGGGGGGRPTRSRRRIGGYFAERLVRPGFAERVEEAFGDLIDNPDQLTVLSAAPQARRRGEARPIAFTIQNFKALEKIVISLPRRDTTGAEATSDPSEEAEPSPAATPALVILGENAAGKSSILEAMALALSDQDVRDDLSLDASRLVLDPRMMGADPAPRREAVVKVRYEDDSTATVAIKTGLPFVEGKDNLRIPVFAYGAFRLFLKANTRPRPSSPIRSLFESNYVLPNPESWLLSLQGKPIFEEVARALKFILALDQDVDVIEADNQARECALLNHVERPGRPPLVMRTPLAAVSSGFRSVLAMACDIMRGLIATQDQFSASLANARAVVLIDEIEAHLHPKWKMRIVHGLRQALPNVTFIATTHDPLCLRGLAGPEVRVFRRVYRLEDGAADDLPSVVEQLDEIPALGFFTIEQLLTSDLFQLHSTDAPEMEDSLARAGDLLAKEKAGSALTDKESSALNAARKLLRDQIGDALPIGSTEVERMIQDAVERFLVGRRGKPHEIVAELREQTRESIIDALEAL